MSRQRDGRYYVHGVGHQKHILKQLQAQGVVKLLKTDEIPYTGTPEAQQAICFQHKRLGCDCGAAWRVIPRHYLTMLGGKVSMAKLFRQQRLTRLCPTTYISLKEFLSSKDCEESTNASLPTKWFIKVSHMNSRKCMLCTADPKAIIDHVEELPKQYRYVIQKEVQNPLLLDGYKILLRLWVLVTVHHDGSVGMHFSRRLRVNKLVSKYDPASSSSTADLEHQPMSIFPDPGKTQAWPLYKPLWRQCVDIADTILRAVFDKWEASGPGMSFASTGGLYNVFAMDYVPSADGKAVLIEANHDPGFKNKCPETKAAAEDLVRFFFSEILHEGRITIPDDSFESVMLPPRSFAQPTEDASLEGSASEDE